jgi:hypothetical protein
MGIVCVVFAMNVTPAAVLAQHSHGELNQRGAMVMGFDQERTTHHFSLFQDGGAIEVLVNEPADEQNRTAIQTHLPHIVSMFSAGQFDAPMLVHARSDVPGIDVMKARAQNIRYNYVTLAGGGRVDIRTNDPIARDAIHEFLKFQIADHATRDSLTIGRR